MEIKYLCALMEIIRNIEKTRMMVKSVATIGVFDGVHEGHQQVIKRLISDAKFHHLTSMVITFDRQPRQLFDPQFRPQLLTTQAEKEREIERLGVDFLVVLPFTKELAALSARDFMEQILKERLNVKMLQVGYDNRFGHDRTEGIEDYRRYGHELGIMVYNGIRLRFEGYTLSVSSSNIRSLIAEEGDVETANIFLGREYELSGKVMKGEHIGHQLGFPTANLQSDDAFKVIPASGVYGVRAIVGDSQKPLPAMMNIGTRPTFDGQNRTLEVNIFDFDGNLYGQTVRIRFLFRLREERKFESPEALVAQLQKDKEMVQYIINKVKS